MRTFIILFVLTAGKFVWAENGVFLLTGNQLDKAMLQGISLETAGEYTVWVWSMDSQPVFVYINDQCLHINRKENAAEAYSWKKVGNFKVEEAGLNSLRLFSDDRAKVLKPRVVGWLALSLQPDWNPEAYFNLTKVFPHSVEKVDDKRLGILRSNRHYYSFPEYDSQWKWLQRKQELRDHILVSMGNYPALAKTPLNAAIFDKIEREDYTIEKVYFESFPGFFVTGNLYRPKGKIGPFPGVVSPHGHWGRGRLADEETGSVPGRAINLARQGHVVFNYDMVGYVDSKQVDHKFGGPQEWLWGISLHGLQFWNSIRAVDFLSSLEDVDPERIGCTGASGGGTQTFCLMAVDNRVKTAAPVNMISAHFQGGCLCENAPNLRIGANNVEFGAMMAPRPLLMVSATGDWTTETPRVEFPAIRSIYELFDAGDHVHSVQVDAPHNYNKLSREAVYAWFGKWLLGVDDPEALREKDFSMEKDEDVRVFPDQLPDNAVTAEQLTAYLKAQSELQLQDVFPKDQPSLRALRLRARTALRHVLGAAQPAAFDLVVQRLHLLQQDHLTIEHVLIGRKGVGDQIPGILLIPQNWSDSNIASLIVHGKGKSALIDPNSGKPNECVQRLLEKGQIVFLPDVFMTGEYDSPFEKARREIDIPHFLTYNQSETALRVQDVLTAAAYLQSRREAKRINLIGLEEAGMWSLLAAPFLQSLDSVMIDACGFENGEDALYLEKLFIPGLRRAGDVRTAQALLAPIPAMIFNTAGKFETKWVETTYNTAGAADSLKIVENEITPDLLDAWLRDLPLE
jgi:dienelactone hydrolase